MENYVELNIKIMVYSNKHRIQFKEIKKLDKYLEFTRKQTKLCNMKVVVVPVIIGALGTV